MPTRHRLLQHLTALTCLLLLLALIVPALAQARERAQKAACASNLHQLGIAEITYAAEYNNALPTVPAISATDYNTRLAGDAPPNGKSPTTNNILVPFWLHITVGIVRDPKVFLCPADPFASTPSLPADPQTKKPFTNFQNQKSLGYSRWYPWCQDPNGNTIPAPWTKLNQMPRGTPYIADMAPFQSAKAAPGEAVPENTAATQPATSHPAPTLVLGDFDTHNRNSLNHNRTGQNALFGDAHVEWLKTPTTAEIVANQRPNAASSTPDNLYTQALDGTETSPNAGQLPAPLPTQPPYDIVMVPTRSAKGDLK
jgi:hypothetical protein